MEPIVVISLFAAALFAVACGCGVLLFRARRDQELIERVVSVVGESFDSRLKTGTTELEHRSQAIDSKMEFAQQRIDEQLSSLLVSLQAKVEAVDKVVLERVGGLTSTVDEKVGGMSQNLSQQVTAMGSELVQVRQLVAQLQKDRAQQHGELTQSLEATIQQQQALNETTGHLREALANPQARGQWGERMAEDVLRAAGMQENFSYRKQTALAGGTKPDFTFMLPHDRLLHMDVKFPATNYLNFLEAQSDSEAARLKDLFLRDVRSRIKELSDRDYAAADTTVGYLLLFIPNESIYGFIHEHDMALLDDAMAQSVVLCSPNTLFAVLRVIRQAMDTYSLERATDEILECLASFGQQWQKFSGYVDKVDRNLETLNKSFGELSGTRRRQLERQLAKIDDIRSRVGAGEDVPVLGSPSTPFLRDVEAG